ncbi:MAG: low molecular weight phosphotyrosine protein phosphatase [Alteromonadaceae bacterium]|nr:low molecular weight phosphotyrosine protein phosphatase [Alteromonadaceae bacterium]
MTTSVLFVCLGNICRSPTAEAIFKKKAKEAGLNLTIDSAGTIAAHQGEPPDRRSAAAGKKRGYDFSGQYSRKVKTSDFHDFDFIFAMDRSNYEDLTSICPPHLQSKIELFLAMTNVADPQVPDPYYGGDKGFELVIDLIEDASDVLVERLKAQ